MLTWFLAMGIIVKTETVTQCRHFWAGGINVENQTGAQGCTIEHRGINVDKAAPSRAREGDVNSKMKGIKVDRA